MNRCLLLLIWMCGPALAQIVGAPSAHGPDESTDRYGRSWYSQRISQDADFGAGTTLDADARESLAQRIDAARRFFKTAEVCALHEEGLAGREAGRLAYLRWWLGLQRVKLASAQDGIPSWRSADVPPGHAVITLWLEPCSP